MMTDYRKIFLRNYAMTMRIGVSEDERRSPQRVLINIELYVKDATTPLNDDIANVLDYDFLIRSLKDLASKSEVMLQETLVDQVVALCLGQAEVHAVRVSCEKVDIYPDCEGVGFEVFKKRNEV